MTRFCLKKNGEERRETVGDWDFFLLRNVKTALFHRMVGKRLSPSRGQKGQNMYGIPWVSFTEEEEEENVPE